MDPLIEKAMAARENAYAPYSEYQVGAALLCGDGSIYTSCNIENAAYGETVCAERTAFFKAVSEGHRVFKAIAIVGSGTNYAFPCGSCRQVMAEFCSADFRILACDKDGNCFEKTLWELFPDSFRPG